MKRKNGVEIGTLTKNTKTSREDDGKRKRTKLSEPEDVESAFAPGLFDASKLAQFTDFHSNSQPYENCRTEKKKILYLFCPDQMIN